jgi:glycosyltransferase involved in cell wall biosynthesis
MTDEPTFQQMIQHRYGEWLKSGAERFPEHERLKIDLHCHDRNSHLTDELWGRILRVPETWVQTDDLVATLKRHRCDVITVTNHNNGRSCWQLLEKGEDVLVGAEFSCYFEAYQLNLHVLVYGFTPEQEVKLNKHRRNLYRFLTYAAENDLPAVLPHPLYFAARQPHPDLTLYEKLALLFDRFEVANGQRDAWQNLLTWEWIESLTEEKIRHWQRKHGLDPANFCRHPERKVVTGGSDDHMGIFAGTGGSYLHVPGLAERLKRERPSAIALDILRHGEIAPYGQAGHHEKLNVTLLDYLSQLTLNMNDPGLLRMFLHQGTLKDKLCCLGAANVIQELKRHRFTVFFFQTLHDALNGKRPGLLRRFRVSKDFRPMMGKIDQIARARQGDPGEYLKTLSDAVPEVFRQLNRVVARRLRDNPELATTFGSELTLDTPSLIRQFEIPSHLRSLFDDEGAGLAEHVTPLNISRFLDRLSFPMLASTLIAGTALIASRSLSANRDLLDDFSRELGRYRHPQRALWLTDTLQDKNGVSRSLSAKLKVIEALDLPIDFLVCSDHIEPRPHLKVVKPVGRFSFPNYREQVIAVPNILEVKQLFFNGGYDRLVCSSEIIMGLVTLYLKHAFSVPAHFFLHTDWLTFIKDTTALEPSIVDRIRRILRLFYQAYDGVFVLNRDDRDWLVSPEMQIERERVFLTAHWAADEFRMAPENEPAISTAQDQRFVLLYAGRLSEEKGVLELPDIFGRLKTVRPEAKMVIAGVGPAESKLRALLPEADFRGWVDKTDMPALYASADLMVLPSRFDTFGNVVLEAMSCGLPVAAYDVKGPKEIIESERYGILAESTTELAEKIAAYAAALSRAGVMRERVRRRAGAFSPDRIMRQLMLDLKFDPVSMVQPQVIPPKKKRTVPRPAVESLKQAV